MTATLIAGATFAFIAAGLYAYVGDRLVKRRVSIDAKRAMVLFAIWWYALAATTFAGGLQSLLAALGVTDLPLFLAITSLTLLLICVGLLGLLYYLLFLFTGRKDLLIPLAVFYALYYVSLVYYITASGPTEVIAGRWSTSIRYASPLSGPVTSAIIVLLVLPQILGALAFLTLYPRVESRTQRYRILLVSLSIVIWFGSALVASFQGLATTDAWQIASRLIGLSAATAVLMAYHPPAWARRRFQVETLDLE